MRFAWDRCLWSGGGVTLRPMPVHPTPTLLLTRPRAASERFAAGIEGAEVVISPLMEIVPTGAEVPTEGLAGLIVTSQNAVPFLPDVAVPAYCVGPRSAAAVGGRAELIGPDADGLVAGLLALAPRGVLLHCHGTHTRGDVVGRLQAGGLTAQGVAVYDQQARPPDTTFRDAVTASGLIVPLFSPRSAQLFAQAVRALPPDAQIIALSPAVADALPAQWRAQTGILAHPNGAEMSNAVRTHIARRNNP